MRIYALSMAMVDSTPAGYVVLAPDAFYCTASAYAATLFEYYLWL